MMNAKFGVLPSKKDFRDYRVKCTTSFPQSESFEWTKLPKVKNQGSVNSCAAHASSSVLEFFNQVETSKYSQLSTDFIYGMQGVAFSRLEEGMYLRDVCKIVSSYGDCSKALISTNTEMPECYEKLKSMLTDDIYKEASICKVQSYAKCKTDEDIKHAIITYGPALGSIKWHSKYSLTDEGVIDFDTQSDNGYHAVMIYGFNENGWLCQNSWGTKWGNKGRFILPYSHGFREVWSFVDAENSDVHKPKRNTFLDSLYKLLNFVLNLFIK